MRKLLLATAARVSTLLAARPAKRPIAQVPAPGTILVHLNGYLQFVLGDVGATACPAVHWGHRHL